MRTYAEERGLRVLWLVRTAAQVRHVAEETGALPVYGRRLLCLHEVIRQVDSRRFNAACRATRYARRCPYWPGRPGAVGHPMGVAELKEHGRRLVTCPYEIAVASMPSSKALIATHKQLPLLGWLFAKWRTSRENVVLVLDEAQNVVRDALSMVRDSIGLGTLRRAASEASRYGFSETAGQLRDAFEKYSSESATETIVEDLLPPITDLLAAGEEVQEMKLRQNLAPASHLLSLADFKAALAGRKPLLVREGESVRLEALADPAEELLRIYEGWAAVVGMSATMPAELVERLTGREATLLRAGWPFNDDALKVVIVRGLTTKYERRDEKLLSDISWVVDVLKGSGKKSLIFLPAFELIPEAGDGVLRESQGMSQEEIDRIAADFDESPSRVLIAVFNGRLSEGVDLSAEVVALVGIPFSPPTPKNQMLLRRLSEILGSEDAKLHGLVLPALYSAVQRP
ncbi:MAG: helicase C-terminal domain-containing protein [Nitrososphaerota archaeon]